MKKYRIVKIEKGHFFVEYKAGCWCEWKMIEKRFKSKEKAKIYIAKRMLEDEYENFNGEPCDLGRKGGCKSMSVAHGCLTCMRKNRRGVC